MASQGTDRTKEFAGLITFVVAATTYTWACWIPNALRKRDGRPVNHLLHFIGGAGPLLAAVAITWADGGSKAAQSLLGRVVAPCPPILLIAAVLVPTAATVVSRLIYRPPESSVQLWLYPVGIVLNAPILPLEEVGWRGFALPRILSLLGSGAVFGECCSMAIASAVTGVVWSVWHAPLFFILKPHLLKSPHHASELLQAVVLYAVGLGSVSFLQGFLVAAAGNGSVIPAILAHATLNGAVGAVLGLDKGVFGLWWLFFGPVTVAITLILRAAVLSI